MNDLSWFLYFADALPKLATAAGVGMYVLMLVFIGIGIANISILVDDISDKVASIIHKLTKIVIALFVCLLFLYIFVPSKDTIYLIAGSEAGEFVVNTPEARAILSDIQEVIQLQIKELKPDDSQRTN